MCLVTSVLFSLIKIRNGIAVGLTVYRNMNDEGFKDKGKVTQRVLKAIV